MRGRVSSALNLLRLFVVKRFSGECDAVSNLRRGATDRTDPLLLVRRDRRARVHDVRRQRDRRTQRVSGCGLRPVPRAGTLALPSLCSWLDGLSYVRRNCKGYP